MLWTQASWHGSWSSAESWAPLGEDIRSGQPPDTDQNGRESPYCHSRVSLLDTKVCQHSHSPRLHSHISGSDAKTDGFDTMLSSSPWAVGMAQYLPWYSLDLSQLTFCDFIILKVPESEGHEQWEGKHYRSVRGENQNLPVIGLGLVYVSACLCHGLAVQWQMALNSATFCRVSRVLGWEVCTMRASPGVCNLDLT